jgi:DNA-binding winged helix-turn-helix (wHTH) protein
MGLSFHVGEWLVEPEQGRLVQGEESKRLDAKAIAVLSFLARHPKDVVTKEELIAAVWDGAFVSDEVLTTAIWGLRKALGDDAKEPRYIQTIPRRGYRLIAPVEKAAGEPSGKWEPSPYPGLSAFSQSDAAYFRGEGCQPGLTPGCPPGHLHLHLPPILALVGRERRRRP